ncbi:MAG: glycosyltransferase family 39 protein [Bacteroidota bacterium]
MLFCVAYFYHYHHVLFYTPQSIHQFRQADCLSIALNYYQGDMNFFKPELHNQMSQGGNSGFAMGEFPIIYYLVAVLWKIFGLHLWLYRFVVIVITFIGLLALFKTFEGVLKDSVWALLLTVLFFTSPIVAFYSNNYLTNMPAFSFALVGWYYFYEFYKKHRTRFLYVSMLFFALSGLLKVSSAISYALVLCIFVFELTGWIKFRNQKKLFNKPAKQFVPILIVPLLILFWYWFANKFNTYYGGSYTFNSVWPIWKMTSVQIAEVWNGFTTFTLHQLFSITNLWFSALMFVSIMVFVALKKIRKVHLFVLCILILGTVFYSLCWFNAFGNHDYYLIDLLMLYLFVCLLFFVGLKNISSRIFNSYITKGVFCVFLVFNILFCQNNMKMRYWIDINKPERFTNQFEIGGWAYMHEVYIKKQKAYETLSYYLREIGVTPKDKVISIPDGSINISLVLMNQKGWTSYGFDCKTQGERIRKLMNLNAKYLLINDSVVYNDSTIMPYTRYYMGSYENIDIYDLQMIR